MGVFNEIRQHPVRLVKSCGLFSCFLTIGLSLGIVGPTLLDFQDKTRSDLKLVSLILPFRAGGYAFGSLVSGLLYERTDVQILTSFTMMVSAGFTLAIPFLNEIWSVLAFFLIIGLCLGLFSASKLILYNKRILIFSLFPNMGIRVTILRNSKYIFESVNIFCFFSNKFDANGLIPIDILFPNLNSEFRFQDEKKTNLFK